MDIKRGYGVVIRNHLGKFLAAAVGPIVSPSSAIHAEFLVARYAVLLVQNHWPEDGQIYFEGDVSLVIATMIGQGDDSSTCGPIINHLRCLLAEMAHSIVNHVQREGNEAAHRLAKMGLSSSQEIVWLEEPPDLIQDILVEEGL
ncbi:uncharacterized protein LOC125468781 [Pyrus x bretschneideri]|uniref:uncharacterized protein LOC125468781 n=1 Tax=Pyrus x bretschneideri TaxID=225117 RepID=UPI00203033AB|nr:uncharacterized protein LOC125468781 [Pyrus x bretschneideri]